MTLGDQPCPPTRPDAPIDILPEGSAPPGAAQVSIVDVVVKYPEGAPREDPHALAELRTQARRSGAQVLGRYRRTATNDPPDEIVLYSAVGYRSDGHACAAEEAGRADSPRPAAGSHSEPVYLSGAEPAVPLEVLLTGAAGTVAVDCEMTEEGALVDCRLRESIHPSMDDGILRSIASRRYRPAMRDGKPIRIRYRVFYSLAVAN